MNVEEIRDYCLAKPGVMESFPFDETTLAFKVMGKIFVLLALDEIPLRINLKCDPCRALELRQEYDQILPGYHMNKKHWNTIIVDDFLPAAELRSWIDESYRLVVQGLNGAMREALEKMV